MKFSVVLHPSFFPPSEKSMSSLQNVLNTPGEQRTTDQWFTLVSQHNRNRPYVVTALSHYTERRPFPDCQHEYIVLEVEERNPTSPKPPPVIIKVSRTIRNGSLPARLGLWGPATDTVDILPSGTQFPHARLHRLTWPHDRAPDLFRASLFIETVHRRMPRYCLLKTSCYAFAGAVKDSIYIRFNGLAQAQRPPLLTREAYFMYCIPVGSTKAQKLANEVAMTDELYLCDGRRLV
ncbi:hypothetical protein L210DRAFT_3525965 [Boletus edulis BED1]|uniref:Uncharacterized protein n=1 Tax=Boletus edulis BED1 TaxID=1328754 RepID=A0AAD4C330_BOLED|nr:hypothetical protein L210DRAFT_3525965 [Boletus edulis BED1]